MGKSALLGYAAEHAGDMQVVRMVAVEAEQDIGFAAVHQLLVPFLRGHGRAARAAAPRAERGLRPGVRTAGRSVPRRARGAHAAVRRRRDPAGALRRRRCPVARRGVGRPAQLRRAPAARRPRSACCSASGRPPDAEPRLQALPSLRLTGLPEQAAHELLETSVSRPIDPHVAARIVAETEGNPLAVVEARRELTPDQLGGTEPLPEPLPVGHRLEASFLRRVRELPARHAGRCWCSRRPVRRARGISCGRRPPTWASPSRRPRPPRRPAWSRSGPRCGSGTHSCARRCTTVPPLPNAASPTARWPRRAIPSSTRSPAPGTWRPRRRGATRESPPSSRRRPSTPAAAAGTPPRPCCSNARRS